MITLLLKVTLLFLAGLIALLTTRRITRDAPPVVRLHPCRFFDSAAGIAVANEDDCVPADFDQCRSSQCRRRWADHRSGRRQMCFLRCGRSARHYFCFGSGSGTGASAAPLAPPRLSRRECTRRTSLSRLPLVCCSRWCSCLAPPRNGRIGREPPRYAMSGRTSSAVTLRRISSRMSRARPGGFIHSRMALRRGPAPRAGNGT